MEGAYILELVMFWIFEKRTVADDVQSGGFGDADSGFAGLLLLRLNRKIEVQSCSFARLAYGDGFSPIQRCISQQDGADAGSPARA